MRAHVKPFDAETWDSQKNPDVWHGGIYALHTFDDLLTTAEVYSADVIGVVELWGRVVRFEHGWRAEMCAVRGLVTWTSNEETVRRLERRYECDVLGGPQDRILAWADLVHSEKILLDMANGTYSHADKRDGA